MRKHFPMLSLGSQEIHGKKNVENHVKNHGKNVENHGMYIYKK